MAILLMAYMLAMVDRIIVGLLAQPIQQALRLTDTELSLLQGLAFAIFYTTLGLPCGWLADRMTRTRLLSAGIAIWSCMTAACAFAGSFLPFFIARIGVGVGEAVLSPTVTSLIADYFEPKRRSAAYGVYQVALAVGTACAWLAGGQLLGWLNQFPSLKLGILGSFAPWQATMLGVGAPGLVVALLLLVTVREPERRNISGEHATWRAAFQHIRANWRAFAFHHVGMAMPVLGLYAWLAWIPTFFLRVYGWPIPDATFWFAVCVGPTGLISALACGLLTARLEASGRLDANMTGALIGVVGSTFFGTLMFLMPTPALSLLMLCGTGIFIVFAPALALASLVEIAPNEMRAKCTAIYLMTLGLLAVAEGPFFVALLTEHVFGQPSSVGSAAAVVIGASGVVGCIILAAGRRYHVIARAAAGSGI